MSKRQPKSASSEPDPILAAIADHRRLWNEYCASIRDVENVNKFEPQTDFFERQAGKWQPLYFGIGNFIRMSEGSVDEVYI